MLESQKLKENKYTKVTHSSLGKTPKVRPNKNVDFLFQGCERINRMERLSDHDKDK